MAARLVLFEGSRDANMSEKNWKWVRTLGSLCVLGCMWSVACSDSEGNGVTAGSGGGGAGGSGNGGTGNGGSSNGGSGNGGTGDGGTDSECRCGGLSPCPDTLAELCADLPEGCPARLETWLTCGERGQIVERDDVSEPYLKECGEYRIVHRQANNIGSRRWIYDAQGRLAAVEDVDDTNLGPRCGVDIPGECRFGERGDPLVSQDAPDAGSDAGTIGDGGITDAGVAEGTDGGGAGDASVLDCSRL
jgi:hypothetical protein